MIQSGKPRQAVNDPEVRALMKEGDDLNTVIMAMVAAVQHDRFKETNPLDQRLFLLQLDSMRQTLSILSLRLARANDAANGLKLDTAPTLAKKPTILNS